MATIHVVRPSVPASAVLHHLPCSIAHDGAAKVSTYFLPEESGAGAERKLTAYFRGRRLDGQVVPLPSGVSGVILRELVGAEAAAAVADAGASDATTPPKPGARSDGRRSDVGVGADAAAEYAAADADDSGGGLFGGGLGEFDIGGDDDEDGDGKGRFAPRGSRGDEDDGAEGGAGGAFSGSKRKAPDSLPARKAGDAAGASSAAPAPRAMVVDARFEQVTSWLHDRAPGDSDLMAVALEWVEVARALHEP
jgi:hypothetical protein